MVMTFYYKRPQNPSYLKKEFMDWPDFLNADSDATMFG